MSEVDDRLGPPWWWCLDHRQVEGPDGCPNTVRMGPYDSTREAASAIERAKARSEAWDHDPVWNDDED